MIGKGLFTRRVRGFRVIEISALAILLVLVLSVYLAKAGAGRERTQIAQVENSIEEEQRQMKLLRAEVAFLEQPERIERLSSQFLGLKPIASDRETAPDALGEVARAALVPKSAARPQSAGPIVIAPSLDLIPAPAPAVEVAGIAAPGDGAAQ